MQRLSHTRGRQAAPDPEGTPSTEAAGELDKLGLRSPVPSPAAAHSAATPQRKRSAPGKMPDAPLSVHEERLMRRLELWRLADFGRRTHGMPYRLIPLACAFFKRLYSTTSVMDLDPALTRYVRGAYRLLVHRSP